VTVWRGTESGQFVTYCVPRLPSQTVLDVVTYIQRQIDPTLSYRFACRVGMCGSCAMEVNGVARWTCRTQVSLVERNGGLTIAPLKNMPVVKDLACDMSTFFDKWSKAHGQFSPTLGRADEVARISPDAKERRLIDPAIECIGCGVCYASCDVVSWRPQYLGPAQLNRAWTLVNDTRDGGQTARLRAVAGDAGCHACHTQMSCSERCPKQLSPSTSIAQLKRAARSAALVDES
jgi:fumarate reductase iron-sulfur subunit